MCRTHVNVAASIASTTIRRRFASALCATLAAWSTTPLLKVSFQTRSAAANRHDYIVCLHVSNQVSLLSSIFCELGLQVRPLLLQHPCSSYRSCFAVHLLKCLRPCLRFVLSPLSHQSHNTHVLTTLQVFWFVFTDWGSPSLQTSLGNVCKVGMVSRYYRHCSKLPSQL